MKSNPIFDVSASHSILYTLYYITFCNYLTLLFSLLVEEFTIHALVTNCWQTHEEFAGKDACKSYSVTAFNVISLTSASLFTLGHSLIH